MTISQLVDYIRLNDIHGVWFWGTGASTAPQKTARGLARSFGQEHYESATRKATRLVDTSKTDVETICGCRELLASKYEQGGSVVVGGLAMPHALIAEISLLVEKGRTVHEWLDDFSVRSKDFYFTFDSSHWKTIDELCNAIGESDAAARLSVTKAIDKFLQVDVGNSESGQVTIRKEPPA